MESCCRGAALFVAFLLLSLPEKVSAKGWTLKNYSESCWLDDGPGGGNLSSTYLVMDRKTRTIEINFFFKDGIFENNSSYLYDLISDKSVMKSGQQKTYSKHIFRVPGLTPADILKLARAKNVTLRIHGRQSATTKLAGSERFIRAMFQNCGWVEAPVQSVAQTLPAVVRPPLQAYTAADPTANSGSAQRPDDAVADRPAMTSVVKKAVAIIGPRLALVVGNGAYAATFGRLANPVNDANAVAAALRRSGFTVTVVTDSDQRTMKRAIAAFGQRLTAAGKGATGLFYYAGHGVQSRGVNYLVPVGANIDSEADVDIEAVAADGVLRQMEEAGASTSIVILDACRNLPIARSSRDGGRGLARMEAPNGSFVAYSTAPGAIAADGTGANSPFAAALVAEMAKPGQQIEITFKNVRRAVMQATGGKQTPWDSSSLVDSFVFVP